MGAKIKNNNIKHNNLFIMRKTCGFTQKKLALAIEEQLYTNGYKAVTINAQEIGRWESGKHQPNDAYLKALCDVLKTNPVEFGFRSRSEFITHLPEHLPFEKNYTGRQKLMEIFQEKLAVNKEKTILALYGAGGIGKTAFIATMISTSEQIKKAFPNGVFWISCNSFTNAKGYNKCLRLLANEILPKTSPHTTFQGIKNIILDYFGQLDHCLVVLDDINPNLEKYLKELFVLLCAGKNTAIILISRQEISKSSDMGILSYSMDPLIPAEANILLARLLQEKNTERPRLAEWNKIPDICETVAYHPLTIRLLSAYYSEHNILIQKDYENLRQLFYNTDLGNTGLKKCFERYHELMKDPKRFLLAALALLDGKYIPREIIISIGQALAEVKHQTIDIPREIDALLKSSILTAAGENNVTLHDIFREYIFDNFQKNFSQEEQLLVLHLIAGVFADFAIKYRDNVFDFHENTIGRQETNIHKALDWSYHQQNYALTSKICLGMAGYWRTNVVSEESTNWQKYIQWGIEANNILMQGLGEETAEYQRFMREKASLQNLNAWFFYNRRELAQAKAVYTETIRIYHTLQYVRGICSTYIAFCETAISDGAWSNAEIYAAAAIRLLDKELNNPNIDDRQKLVRNRGEAELMEAKIAWFREDYAIALDKLHNAEKFFETCRDDWGLVTCWSLLGHIYLDTKHNTQLAVQYISKIRETDVRKKDVTQTDNDTTDWILSAKFLMECNRLTNAENVLLYYISEHDDIVFYEYLAIANYILGLVYVKQHKPDKAIVCLQKAAQLNSMHFGPITKKSLQYLAELKVLL